MSICDDGAQTVGFYVHNDGATAGCEHVECDIHVICLKHGALFKRTSITPTPQ